MTWNDTVIEQFRAGSPRILDRFDRESLVLLHTTGARTGEKRINPVAGLDVDGRLVVIASAAGRPKNPAWYHNLLANPAVHVERWEDGALVEFDAEAAPVQGADRDALWAEAVRRAPGFGDYQENTERLIPVVVLDRTG